jgi:ribosome-associated protein
MLKKNITKKVSVIEDKGRITSQRALHIAADLSWNYGEDVVVYDVREKTPYVSYYIVASASNDRRLRALVATGKESLYNNYKDVDHTEGRNDSNWILVDAHDVVLQLFTKEERKRVDFDSLYADVPHKVVKAMEEPVYRKRKKPESVGGNY